MLKPPLIRIHKNVVSEAAIALDNTPTSTPRMDETNNTNNTNNTNSSSSNNGSSGMNNGFSMSNGSIPVISPTMGLMHTNTGSNNPTPRTTPRSTAISPDEK